jgi:hypothetical protein
MNVYRLLKCAAAVGAIAIGSACAGGSPVGPSANALDARYVGRTLFVNGRPVTAERLYPAPPYAELLPEKRAKSKDYEYIFNQYGTYASIFNYPKNTAEIGQVNGAGGQGCTNVLYGYGKKIIWNIGGPKRIYEYRVPSNKVLKRLKVNYSFASSCGMNANGDLAVGILYGTYYGAGGQVVIFKNATGSGTVYDTPLDEEFFNGYDNQGNLFADGFTGNRSGFALVELPQGSSKFVTVKTSNSPGFPGSVQWDGTYLTVFDQDTSETYQYTVSGATATLKNTVKYYGASDCAQTWIVKGLIYCGDFGNNNGSVFKYPAGGSPVATFTGKFDGPLGVTAAKK